MIGGLRDDRCKRGGDLYATGSATAAIGWFDSSGWTFLDGDGSTRGRREGYVEALGEDLWRSTAAHLTLRGHGRYLGGNGSVGHGVDNAGGTYLKTDFAGGLHAGVWAIFAAEMFGNLNKVHLCASRDGMDNMGLDHNTVKELKS